MKFGDFIRDQRTSKDWTQPQAAEKIGIEQSYLSKLETGKAIPSEEIFNKLADAYGFDIKDLGDHLLVGELAKLRDIKAVQDYVTTRDRIERGSARKWLMAGLMMLGLGAAITAYEIHRPLKTTLYQYASKGVIKTGEDEYIFVDMPTQKSLFELKSNKRRIEGWQEAEKAISDKIDNLAADTDDRTDSPSVDIGRNQQIAALRAQLKNVRASQFIEVDTGHGDFARRTGANASLNILASPLIDRLDYDYITTGAQGPISFLKEVDGGRRLYVRNRRHINVIDGGGRNPWLYGIGIALIVMGFASFYVSRRWR